MHIKCSHTSPRSHWRASSSSLTSFPHVTHLSSCSLSDNCPEFTLFGPIVLLILLRCPISLGQSCKSRRQLVLNWRTRRPFRGERVSISHYSIYTQTLVLFNSWLWKCKKNLATKAHYNSYNSKRVFNFQSRDLPDDSLTRPSWSVARLLWSITYDKWYWSW